MMKVRLRINVHLILVMMTQADIKLERYTPPITIRQQHALIGKKRMRGVTILFAIMWEDLATG